MNPPIHNHPEEPVPTPPQEPVLHAHSPRQAMDWSLVLLSQGIESTLESTPHGWQLRVAPDQWTQARTCIAQFELENRPRPWHSELPATGLLFDWSSLAWAAVTTVFYLLQRGSPLYAEQGLMHGAAVWDGQWWRLFTAIWLHADATHLTLNLTCGVPLLGLAMGGYGTGPAFLAALLAGAGGNLLALLINGSTHQSLGASGLVMGTLGLLTARGLWWHLRVQSDRRWGYAALAAGVMLFLLLGASEGSDLVAHAGGWFSGLLLGSFTMPWTNRIRRGAINLAAGLAAAAITLLTWWLALRNARG